MTDGSLFPFADDTSSSLAKITWQHPETGVVQGYVLMEGATVTIGRASNNDIQVPEQHVSRQHAVINYRDGIFMINDLNSANGTFVNDQQLTEPFPLADGDRIRLYVPVLVFSAAVSLEEAKRAEETGTFITALRGTGNARLIITTGPQEGEVIPLALDEVTVGRATTNYTWEIGLQDPSVSRPHAKLVRDDQRWVLHDLGSSNGTLINNETLGEYPRVLADGDVIAFGATLVLFRAG